MINNLQLLQSPELSHLSVRDKCGLLAERSVRPTDLGLILISNLSQQAVNKKWVYYDEHKGVYVSIWDDQRGEKTIDSTFLAGEEAEYAMKAQYQHLLLRGREDIANELITVTGNDIGIVAVPKLGDKTLSQVVEQKTGPTISIRAVNEFILSMIDANAPINSDCNGTNIIVSSENVLYGIDFTLRRSTNLRAMLKSLAKIGIAMHIEWDELATEFTTLLTDNYQPYRLYNRAEYTQELIRREIKRA